MSPAALGKLTDRSFGDAVRIFETGEADAHAVHRAFLGTRFWCEAGDRPGLQALGPPGADFVPVFTSEAELARARGAVRWFSTTGADLLDLLPDRCDLVVDMRGEAPLRLRATAVRRSAVVEIDWRA